MKYLRLYADDAGESHVEEVTVPLQSVVYAPPAPALEISSTTAATGYLHVRFPPGWDSQLHPAPRRQLFIMLAGSLICGLSNGDEIELKAGDVVKMEDTTGKGHTARTGGNQEVLAIMAPLE